MITGQLSPYLPQPYTGEASRTLERFQIHYRVARYW